MNNGKKIGRGLIGLCAIMLGYYELNSLHRKDELFSYSKYRVSNGFILKKSFSKLNNGSSSLKDIKISVLYGEYLSYKDLNGDGKVDEIERIMMEPGWPPIIIEKFSRDKDYTEGRAWFDNADFLIRREIESKDSKF